MEPNADRVRREREDQHPPGKLSHSGTPGDSLAAGRDARIAWSMVLALAMVAGRARSQNTATGTGRVDVAGAVTLTNKGISIVPTFTLGKPAAIFDLSIRRHALAFEPQLRFGLDGKPWTFIFWGRYRAAVGDRLSVTAGANPTLAFQTISIPVSGAFRHVIVARRYLTGELNPMYSLSRHASVGTYYLYSYGIERAVVKHTHYLAARSNLVEGPASGRFLVRFIPQLYYLRLDRRDGYYANGSLTASSRHLPLSVSTMVNTPLRTRIAEGRESLWNVSLTYTID